MDSLSCFLRITRCMQKIANFSKLSLFLNNRVGLHLKSGYASVIFLASLHWYFCNVVKNHTLKEDILRISLEIVTDIAGFFPKEDDNHEQVKSLLISVGAGLSLKTVTVIGIASSPADVAQGKNLRGKHALTKADGCNDLSTNPSYPPFSSSLPLLWFFKSLPFPEMEMIGSLDGKRITLPLLRSI